MPNALIECYAILQHSSSKRMKTLFKKVLRYHLPVNRLPQISIKRMKTLFNQMCYCYRCRDRLLPITPISVSILGRFSFRHRPLWALVDFLELFYILLPSYISHKNVFWWGKKWNLNYSIWFSNLVKQLLSGMLLLRRLRWRRLFLSHFLKTIWSI